MKLQRTTLVLLSGILPFIVGLALLRFGLSLIVKASKEALYHIDQFPLLSSLKSITLSLEMSALLVIVLALTLGWLKGRFVMVKNAKKNIFRILSLENPSSLTKIYSVRYYIVVASMMGVGLLMNLLAVPQDIRGLIDAAVGSALIQGALVSFRQSLALKRAPTETL